MVIAQISDTHILAKSSGGNPGAARAENLRRCIADINRQGVDAVVHTGDSVHQGLAEEYAHLRQILDEMEAPLLLVPGNRDRRDALRAALGHLTCLPATGEFLHYAIEDHPVRLVGLDSVSPGERKGVYCARRLAWLDETLSRAPEKPTVLFIHHPPCDIAPYYMDGYRRRQEAEDLEAVVRRHGQVARLLCGHVHRFHRAPWGGATVTATPSVAVDLRKGDDVADRMAPCYLLHAGTPDGGLVSRVRAA